MRTLVGGLGLVVVLAACGGSADSAADAAADSSAAMAAAEPAGLTPADVAGRWAGMSMPEVGDSITSRWTIQSTSDGAGWLLFDGAADTIAYTMVYDGDSVVATSAPYTDPAMPPGSPQVMFRSVGRLMDGKFAGTSAIMTASMPDSVIARGRWEAMRAP